MMHGARHRSNAYMAAVGALSLSFWSSGVFLIRTLAAYDIWSSQTYVAVLFLLSVLLVWVSILGVRRLFSDSRQGDRAVLDTLASVLLLHGIALASAPSLYSLFASESLTAAAWLLWFGGVALALALYSKSS